MGQTDSLDKQEASDSEKMRNGIAELMQLAYDQAQSQGAESLKASIVALALKAARMTMFHCDARTGESIVAGDIKGVYGVDSPDPFPTFEAFLESVHPEDRERLAQGKALAFATGGMPEVEFRLAWPNGEVRWIAARGELFRDELGNPTAMVGVHLDITERKRADDELRRVERRYRELFDSAPVGYHELDVHGRIVRVNRTEQTMLGYRSDEMLGRHIWDFIAKPDHAQEDFHDVMTGRSSLVRAVEREYLRKDGTTLPVIAERNLLKDSRGRVSGMRVTLQDISGRKHLEEQLLQLQKMEAVGRLAGGIAHDFNNILTAIINYAYLARVSERPQDAVGFLEEVERASERASQLTQQLLVFSRRQMIEPRNVNLNDVIVDMERMLRRLISEDIELVTLLGDGLNLVVVDPRQMERVLINLVLNARDAMPDGGKLIIQTSNAMIDDRGVPEVPSLGPGRYVKVTVGDSGVGMSKEVSSHIFEPFFTTKEIGEGTGLGLSTCYGIVGQSGGHMVVDSEPGKGTTVAIYLPATEGEASPLPLRDEEGFLPTGNETVMLVEDEPSVREVTARVLREQGYSILEAANGVDAMKTVGASSPESVDLVMTDLVMPLMGGTELAAELKRLRPNLQVLYVSGYSDDTAVRRQVMEEGAAFLHKPFTPSQLAHKVRAVLDSRRSQFPPTG